MDKFCLTYKLKYHKMPDSMSSRLKWRKTALETLFRRFYVDLHLSFLLEDLERVR